MSNSPHRLLAALKAQSDHIMSHDEKMALIWKLINPNRFWHKHEMKPFTWNISYVGGQIYNLLFSSISAGDTAYIKNSLLACEGSISLPNYGTNYIINDLMDLPDYDLKDGVIRLYSISGCQCFKHKQKPGTRKKYYALVSAEEAPEDFATSIKNNIIRRGEKFLDRHIDEDEVSVKYVELERTARVKYKTGNILTQFVSLQLKAPKDIQKVAAYGGIGKETGSGFGFVMLG